MTGVLEPPRQQSYFERVRLVDRVPTWPNGEELAPDGLRADQRPGSELLTIHTAAPTSRSAEPKAGTFAACYKRLLFASNVSKAESTLSCYRMKWAFKTEIGTKSTGCATSSESASGSCGRDGLVSGFRFGRCYGWRRCCFLLAASS